MRGRVGPFVICDCHLGCRWTIIIYRGWYLREPDATTQNFLLTHDVDASARPCVRPFAALFLAVLVIVAALSSPVARAQTGSVTVLHDFIGPPNGFASQAALVQGNDGNFYGTTQSGGLYQKGTIFKVTPGSVLTTLYTFDNTGLHGGNVQAKLILGSDGNFYGTTANGGGATKGTVFRITPGGDLTTLCSFGTNGNTGDTPAGGAIQGTDGNFYGTTEYGGTFTIGTVYKMTPQGVVTTLHEFSGPTTEGHLPLGELVQGSDGNFYGTTTYGRTDNLGTVFVVTSSGLTTLHSFTGGIDGDGSHPEAALVEGSDGILRHDPRRRHELYRRGVPDYARRGVDHHQQLHRCRRVRPPGRAD